MDKPPATKRAAGVAHLVLGSLMMFFCWPYTQDAIGVLGSSSDLDRGTGRGIILLFIIPFLIGMLIAAIGVKMIATGRVAGERREQPEPIDNPAS